MFFAKLAFLAYFALSPILSLLAPAAPATGMQSISLEQAQQAAQAMLDLQVSAGYAQTWSGAVLEPGVTLYDLSGAVSAYLFPVSANDQAQGYLLVAAYDLPQPVLEFATSGSAPFKAAPARPAAYDLMDGKPLYLGTMTYMYELVDAQGAHALLDINDGQVTVLDPGSPRPVLAALLPDDATLAPLSALTPSGTVVSKLIADVPDWNQFYGAPYGYACASGCGPTAAVNIIGYYDQHGYPNLMDFNNYYTATNAMRTYMRTVCDGSSGSTSASSMGPGMTRYTRNNGRYFSTSASYYSWNADGGFSTLQAEIDAGRPVLFGVWSDPTYGDHAVTGIGYNITTNANYIIIHDNWSPSGDDIQIQFGAGYEAHAIVTLNMTNLFWTDTYVPMIAK